MAQTIGWPSRLDMQRLWADVNLSAEPFFSHSSFVVEARQHVKVRSVLLANARMAKALSGV